MATIKCPECDHEGEVLVAIWGTGRLLIQKGKIVLSNQSINIDEKDYYECPECEHKGIREDFVKD